AAGPSATAQGVTVTIDKSNYQQGEEITISYSGMIPANEAGTDYDGAFTISKVGSDHKTFVREDNTSIYNVGASGEVIMNAPSEDGEYELRLYTESWSYWYNDNSFVLKIPFTVGAVKTGAISLPQTEYIANEKMVVDYNGITAEMVSAGAFIGIFKEGEAVSAWLKQDNDVVKEGAGQVTLDVPNINGKFEVRLYNVKSSNAGESNLIMSLPITISGATASEWAVAELERAEELGLIPDCLEGEDLTQDITRAEFAAVAVKVYEALSGTPAIPIVNNPFTDTGDVEVLKAYNIGAVNGTSATTYEPNALLNREQAATMLTRVFKKVTMAGWTLATDSQFTLPYTKPAAFADDKDISDWAKDSVYFMSANGIVGGVGNGKFAPKNITTEEQATGYANATREQALLIAVRMVENLGK
ncbi:MAG: S-layer homology domain-containing protein, partial [Firmicutes bacterium]|nr:S-layer homology domain-containing protein [Bacillota bacterium]